MFGFCFLSLDGLICGPGDVADTNGQSGKKQRNVIIATVTSVVVCLLVTSSVMFLFIKYRIDCRITRRSRHILVENEVTEHMSQPGTDTTL